MTAQEAIKKGRSKKCIIKEDVRYGLNRVKAKLVRLIGDVGLPKDYEKCDITVEKMMARLKDIEKSPRKVESDPINLLLLQAQAVLEYNGEGWHRVHPLVAEHLKER